MECRNIIESLSNYLDGLLTDNETALVESHLTSCPPCQTVKLELSEIRTAARDLPLHTPPRAMWTRISNVLEVELAAGQAPTTKALPQANWWERLKSKTFTFSLPQLTGAGVIALALITFSSVSFYRRYNSVLTLRGMQTAALFAEEAQLKVDLDRKFESIKARMSGWNPQRRDDFQQKLDRIETAIQDCRHHLQNNPHDELHQVKMRHLYQEKRLLLEDVERLK